jgi:predicted regulator of Ras-like GTPase activity (Roadblock/LC7/MglB family)
MVVSSRGAIHAVHGIEDRESVRKTARAVTALLGSQRNVEGLLGVGVADFALLEGSKGSISLMWLDDERQIALIVLLNERGRTGVLRHTMRQAVDELTDFVGAGPTRKRGEAQ